MTGRDLIIYILEHDLLDTPMFGDGKLIGFITPEEAAVKHNVGVAMIMFWIRTKDIPYISNGETIYIPDCYETLEF